MTAKRSMVAGIVMTGAALLAVAGGYTIANAADEPATDPTTAPSGHPWHHHGWGPWRMYGKLGLTAEQKASIKTLMSDARPQMQALHEQMRANQLKLLQTNPGQSNYSSVVAEVAQSNAALMSQRATQDAQIQTQIYNTVLTAAQRTQYSALQAQMAARIAARQAPVQ
jgi:Spy/CpxP family protein refolding chaperone